MLAALPSYAPRQSETSEYTIVRTTPHNMSIPAVSS